MEGFDLKNQRMSRIPIWLWLAASKRIPIPFAGIGIFFCQRV